MKTPNKIQREKLVSAMQQLPAEASLDDVLDRVLLLAKTEEGMAQSMQDRVTPDSELDKRLPEWLS